MIIQLLAQGDTGIHKISIPFLLNWTNPHRGLTDTFERSSDMIVHTESAQVDVGTGILGEVEASANDGELCASFNTERVLKTFQEGYVPPSPMPDDLSLDMTLGVDTDMPLSSIYELGVSDNFSPSMFLPLQETLHSTRFVTPAGQVGTGSPITYDLMGRDLPAEFAEELTTLTLSLPRDHPERAPSINLALGMTIFTEANIERFLWLYFHHWNRHSPVLHRGTFDVADASLALVLVMTLTGALFSLSPGEVTMAQSMLDLAEEFSFRNPDFERIMSGIFPEGPHERRRALQAIQAAFSAAQLQLREGSSCKRQHVRSHRFDQIIYALRTMSLHNGSADESDNSADRPGFLAWRTWAERESGLRLLYGIFHLDVAFTIFYDQTPRLFYHEIQMSRPCSADAYMAESFEACREILLSENRTSCLLFPETVLALAKNRSEEVSSMKDFNLFYLFSVIFGLLQIIQSSRRRGYSAERIQHGLQLWKVKWDETVLQMTPTQQQTSGFIRNAGPEFWYLACYLANTAATRGDPDSIGNGVFKELLQRAKVLR
ncbi:Fungal specific transcription factor domain-containing protein [Cladophialophora immunda]|nr:Fungal specific transcription factor domain-containing protein [Cladophialophora immunda]